MTAFGLGGPSSSSSAAIPQEEIDSSTPWLAAADGKLPLLQAALQTLQLTPAAADENGYTLLMAAASYVQIEVIQWLLSHKTSDNNLLVPVNAVDNDGDSAIHHAGSKEAIQLLVEVGHANPHQPNSQGKVAVQCKQEERNEILGDEDDDCEDAENLRKQIEYLASLK